MPPIPTGPDRHEWTRRALLQAGAASGAMASEFLPSMRDPSTVQTTSSEPAPAAITAPVTLRVNGEEHRLVLDTRTSLLDALREHLHLTGAKKGCDHGQCGACTVLLNGRRVNSCLTLAVMLAGDEIGTIEGLGTSGQLHPLQAAFIARDGFQCGYCTPGQICSAVGMLGELRENWPSHVTKDVADETIAATDPEIRERMSGNICRCSAYTNILAAIRDVMDGTER
jgi:xanthine dehydrogenase YagT iron-sulfur-binding subunit